MLEAVALGDTLITQISNTETGDPAMTLHSHFDRLPCFLRSLDAKTAEEQAEAFMNEVIESGGTYVRPTNTNWSSHMFEVSLHHVSGFGGSEGEAIQNWIKAARRQLERIEDDGFVTVHPPLPTPRNHAEEIANAREDLERAAVMLCGVV